MLLSGDKTVHQAAIKCSSGAVLAVVEVLRSQSRQVVWRDRTGGRPRGVDGNAGSSGQTVRAGKRAEVVIEGVVLLHDHEHVLEARGGVGVDGHRAAV